MIASMTGYGKAFAEFPGKKITVEIKSLNSKQLDISVKLPGIFREKEAEIRNSIAQQLERGKIDLVFSMEVTGDMLNYSINRALARKYGQELKELSAEMGEQDPESLLSLVLKMPDVLQTHRDEIDEQEWNILNAAIGEVLAQVKEFRINEGRILEKDIRSRIDLILSYLGSLGPYEKSRVDDIRERLVREFQNYKTDSRSTPPEDNRFEQELIFYFERLDITEEKVRLKKHCDYFMETLEDKGSQGKKLGFIVQEMGREINTIGSKANHAEIQKIVVMMKDELEKIKEQLGNIL
jgi:uncharacterized protein (TIGR00255 family)